MDVFFFVQKQAPLGFWDPLGLSSDGDLYSFKRRRSVEFKHGRISMLEHCLHTLEVDI